MGVLRNDLAGVWINSLRCRYPTDPFSSAPLADFLCVDLQIHFTTDSVLLILVPGTPVLLLVRVGHGALALLSTADKESFVSFAVLPDLGTVAMHVCVLEFARVRFPKVCEEVSTLSLEHSVYEVALVVAAVGPLVPSLAILLAVLETTLVARCI